MRLADGQRVAYVGEGEDGLSVDDRGKVLSCGTTGSHVKWLTGARAGQITLTANMDIVPVSGRMAYDDLESGSLVTFAVKDTYEWGGKVALLNALTDEGHCATFESIAEEAIQLVATRLREDPSIKEVLSSLDEDDGSEFVSFTAVAILRDAFGEG